MVQKLNCSKSKMEAGSLIDQRANEPSAEMLHEWDRNHQLHPWAAMHDWRGYDHMLVQNSKGIYLWDDSGKRFIDGLAECGACKSGMGVRKWRML